ncbi:hypothetical protein CMO91_03555 [Candidatus Woesearchaeota archaeon]|nr:hypothetical protein [Candidatus Woesearchaeota archaeon]
MTVLNELTIILVIAAVMAVLADRLKQPPIMGYILAGLLLGPSFLGVLQDQQLIVILSEIGIAFLLFMVGLELDVRKLKEVGKISVLAGIAQVAFTFGAGYYFLRMLSYSAQTSLYLSLALTLSSTVLVIKLLSDKRELHSLHGRIALGILLVQDVIAVLALGVLGSTSTPMMAVLKGVLLLATGIIGGAYVIKPIFARAKSQETIFMLSIAWCFLLSAGAARLEFSIAIGGFLAGVSLASTAYAVEISSRVKALRDFFATLFFISVGSQVVLQSSAILSLLALAAFVLIGNPLIVFLFMVIAGFKSHTSFVTGLSIAQVGEFGLLLVALAYNNGLVGAETLSAIALLVGLTFMVSTYYISRSHDIYKRFERFLKPFEHLSLSKQTRFFRERNSKYDVIIFGANRIGRVVIDQLKKKHKNMLVVEYNPSTVKELQKDKISVILGDVSDAEVIDAVPLKHAKMVVSTVTDPKASLLLLSHGSKKTKIIVTAEQPRDALMLYKAGAEHVIIPHLMGALHLSKLIKKKNLPKDRYKKHLYTLYQ